LSIGLVVVPSVYYSTLRRSLACLLVQRFVSAHRDSEASLSEYRAAAGVRAVANSARFADSQTRRMKLANQITGPNAGEPRQFPIWALLAARVGQFCRSAQ